MFVCVRSNSTPKALRSKAQGWRACAPTLGRVARNDIQRQGRCVWNRTTDWRIERGFGIGKSFCNRYATPSELVDAARISPRVDAQARQPWALLRNAFGVERQIALILMMFVCCSSFAADKIVTNKELGFEITFPESWEINEHDAWCQNCLAGYSPISHAANILVSDSGASKEKSTAKSWAQNYANAECASEENVVILKYKLGEMDAYKVSSILKAHDQTEKDVQYTYYFIISGKRKFLMRTVILDGYYDKYSKDIDAIVQSALFTSA